MVVSRALRATGCASCRLNLLRSFTAIAGLPPRTPYLNARISYLPSAPRVRFSSSTIDNGEQSPGTPNKTIEEEKLDEGVAEEMAGEDTEAAGRSSEVSAVPWYLEVNAPQPEPQPLSERQQIPELPDSPPPTLQPLLQQISVDLGLDSLTLLDLRKLDPPPALGANLIMVLGTARSEKHLHVSADRLCRWLRSTYKLRPDADGLLGRNELKLKLKRKSKRAKLLGKSTADNEDDGVRTGWVCVDVGVVDGAAGSMSSLAEPSGFVGFGRRTDGVRIVVQMMTEEKREEMDLERLWSGILKRGVPDAIKASDEATTSEPSNSVPEHTLTYGSMPRLGNGPSIVSHSRGFHTSARNLFVEAGAIKPAKEGPIPEFQATQINITEMPALNDIQEIVAKYVGAGQYEEATQYLLQQKNDTPELQNEAWRRLLLSQLRVYLENVPSDQALLDLGQSATDRDSTLLLKCFHQSLSLYPSKFEGDMQVWLYCYARKLGHTGYNFKGLMTLLEEIQMNGVEVSTKSYLQLLRSALQVQHVEGKYHGPPRHRVEGAMKILQAMYDRGHNILTEDVFVTLQEATAPMPGLESENPSIYTSSSDTFDLPSKKMSAIQRRIHVLMRSIDMPKFRAESRLRLLDLYSRQNNWKEFWDLWRLALRQGQPQTAILYAFMFNRVAETMHQKACINVLRTWFPDVQREVPAVPLEGEVARAIQACLLVADPFVERDSNNPKAKGEWISMWRTCTGSGN
ncbi:ATPase synthesis [Hyphodiscus hymeniophilus]|uniref:ATPase synthesis protein 25 n=1 Tax=Hyphodiscus hymeniophilus TaxID=353542 RepID=A0A9P7B0V9_9HELO|nr:ATPase synthesis [Hyphodiscus hymeniophilus]